MLIDSHCHLDFSDLAETLGEVVARAGAAGVQKIVTICTRLDKFEAVKALADRYEGIYMTAGVHPHEAGEAGLDDPEHLKSLCTLPQVVGVGETGLDYFYARSPQRAQQGSFRAHISVSRDTGLPLIVHTRDAEADTVQILQDEARRGSFAGLIHCFTGTPYLRDAALELGLYISVSGIATFKKSEDLRQTLAGVPLNRILLETDAPFLAPMPHRGKTNEPSFLVHTAKKMAEVFHMSACEFASQTTANFHRLFTKVPV